MTRRGRLANATTDALCQEELVPPDHHVWSDRRYKVFRHTPHDVIDRIGYVEENPQKEGLPRQYGPFVKPHPPQVVPSRSRRSLGRQRLEPESGISREARPRGGVGDRF